MKELKLADVKDFGNAEIVGTININGICVGDHCAADYPQIVWTAKGELKTGEKVNIYYRTKPEDVNMAKSHGLDAIDWDSRFWKIELDED